MYVAVSQDCIGEPASEEKNSLNGILFQLNEYQTAETEKGQSSCGMSSSSENQFQPQDLGNGVIQRLHNFDNPEIDFQMEEPDSD